MKNRKSFLTKVRCTLFLLCLFLPGITANAQITGKFLATGIVTDDRGEPIMGATVVALGTPSSTITDANGKFTFTIPDNTELRITFIGSIPKTVNSSRTFMKIILSDDNKQLAEAVAIGYATVKRANMLGAVVSLSGSEIEDIPVGNLSQTLVGKLAAVSVSETTGRPGSSTPLTIRTSGSFSTDADVPLFIINGVICESQDEFDMLDPTEVESISILKDAAAAVYGARAAGGAVIVTLKKGKEGKARISYSGQIGYETPTEFPTMLSAYDQAVLLNEKARGSSGSSISTSNDFDYSTNSSMYTVDELDAFKDMNYNWLDYAWQNSYSLRQTINLSGGSDKVRYFAGGSMWKENGNFQNIEVNKYTLRTSLEADVTDEVTASLELSVNNQKKLYPYMEGDGQDNMNGLYKLLLSTPYWQPGKVGDNYVENGDEVNPLALLESDCYKKSLSTNTGINASLTYKPKYISGLTASVRFNYKDTHSSERQRVTTYTAWEYGVSGTNNHIYDITNPLESSVKNSGNSKLSLIYGQGTSYQLNAGLNYDKSFGDHHITALLNYEQSESNTDEGRLRKNGEIVPGLDRMSAYSKIEYATSSMTNSGRLSMIGRFSYDYKNKYLLESSFREEASVKFDADNRWGFFPQLSLGWRISEEDFYKDHVNFMNYLKIRASAGLLGQDNGVGSYEYLYAYVLSEDNDDPAQFFGDGSTDSGLLSGLGVENNGIVTSGVTWEKTQSYNIGVDAKFLNGAIDFSIDGYFKHTWDIFDQVYLVYPDILGAGSTSSSSPKINYGIENAWGTDIELGYNGKFSNDANYYIKGNFSWGDNKVIKRYQDPKYKNTYAWDEGKSDNRLDYCYKTNGIFRTQEQLDSYMAEHPGMTYWGETPKLGMLIFEDVARAGNTSGGEGYYVNEKDGVVDDYDVTDVGKKSGTPFAYGFSLGSSYKTLRIDMTFTGGWGGYTMMHKDERVSSTPLTSTTNVPSYWKDSWTPDNTDAKYPSVAYSVNGKEADFWLRSASVLRLRTINLSYTLPKNLTTKWRVPSARFFLTCTNLLTLWDDFDYKDGNLARYYDYPLMRSFNFGLNLNL
jgi:TonB-linked SusC/RagA family outer membrane protein